MQFHGRLLHAGFTGEKASVIVEVRVLEPRIKFGIAAG